MSSIKFPCRLLQHFIRLVLLLWHSLLIYRGLLLLFGKGRPRSLWMQKKFALTSKKECTAGKIGARIPSGGGCEGRGGSRRTCTALLRFRQTCSRRQAQSPERRRWQSSGAWRCPRDQRVRHRPWELHWEPDTGGIPSNTHRQSRTSAVLICSRCDRFWREMQCELQKNNETLGEPQNYGYTTSTCAHFFGKVFHNLKIILQNKDFFVSLTFSRSSSQSQKHRKSHRHVSGKQRPSLGPNVCQESLHLTWSPPTWLLQVHCTDSSRSQVCGSQQAAHTQKKAARRFYLQFRCYRSQSLLTRHPSFSCWSLIYSSKLILFFKVLLNYVHVFGCINPAWKKQWEKKKK